MDLMMRWGLKIRSRFLLMNGEVTDVTIWIGLTQELACEKIM